MSVVVDYRGPRLMRPLAEKLGIPIFDRVSQLKYRVSDLNEIELSKKDVSRLHELQQISISKRSATPFDESDVDAFQELVPPCRVAKFDKTGKQIEVQLDQWSHFTSCSK